MSNRFVRRECAYITSQSESRPEDRPSNVFGDTLLLCAIRLQTRRSRLACRYQPHPPFEVRCLGRLDSNGRRRRTMQQSRHHRGKKEKSPRSGQQSAARCCAGSCSYLHVGTTHIIGSKAFHPTLPQTFSRQVPHFSLTICPDGANLMVINTPKDIEQLHAASF